MCVKLCHGEGLWSCKGTDIQHDTMARAAHDGVLLQCELRFRGNITKQPPQHIYTVNIYILLEPLNV